MKQFFIGLEFIAAIIAVMVASAVVGGTVWSAGMIKAASDKARADAAAANKSPAQLSPVAAHGQKLFAVNCSHCHADDATGDEGPDLHGLTKSDERIKAIITNGVKGEMPSFAKKLQEEDKEALVQFLRSLG